MPIPEAYFITFRTYGTWLHGDERGSVDHEHRTPGTPFVPPNPAREQRARSRMTDGAVLLNAHARDVIDRTIREVCDHRRWNALAVNARTNHVHVIVHANAPPEKILIDFKAWCTRRLIEAGCVARGQKVWAEHGSTIYLWTHELVQAKIDYVTRLQDLPGRFEQENARSAPISEPEA